MNIKRLNCLFVLTALIVSGFATGTTANEAYRLGGTTAAAWLKIGVGGRAAAMGESYTAICDDASAIFWNPANLSRVRENQVMTQYGMWLADMGYHALSFTIPIIPKKKSEIEDNLYEEEEPSPPRKRSRRYSKYEPDYFAYSDARSGRIQKEVKKEVIPPGGTIGVGVSYFDYGNIPGYDETGNPEEDFAANSYCAMVSYSNALGEAIGIGFTAKMISETIETETETVLAGDAGLSLTAGSISLGLVMQNMGATLGGANLPQNTKIGAALQMGPLTISCDYIIPNDHAPKTNVGVEFYLGKTIALRGGYMTGTDNVGEGMSRLSAGVGLDMGSLSVDVAYVPFGDYFGDTLRTSLIFKFQ